MFSGMVKAGSAVLSLSHIKLQFKKNPSDNLVEANKNSFPLYKILYTVNNSQYLDMLLCVGGA